MGFHIQPCAGCHKGIPTRYSNKHRRIAGTGAIHNDCRAICHLCGNDVEDGSSKAVYYLKKIVHDACKQTALAAKRQGAVVTILPPGKRRV